MKTVDFYFDYLSGFAYFAWLQLPSICETRGVSLNIHPVLFAGLLDHWGQLGPAEISPKKEFIYKLGYRYAKLKGWTFNPPKYHPFNPLPALRVSLKEVCGEKQKQVLSAIFHAGWSEGKDLGSSDELTKILDGASLNGASLLEKTTHPSIKEILKKETDEAIARGVFGVPTMIFDDELFWGADQMEFIALALDGKDPLDKEKVREMLNRPRAVDRKH